MLNVLVCYLFVVQAPAGVSEVPFALRMALQCRRDIGTLDIRWRSLEHREGQPPRRDWRAASLSGPIERLHHSRLAWNGDFAYEDLGDSEGVYQYDEQGLPVCVTSRGCLVGKSGDVWDYARGTAAASFWKNKNVEEWRHFCPLKDIRALGLVAHLKSYERLETDDVLKLGRGDSLFEEEVLADGIHRVSRVENATGQRMIWYINPEKGWNPERVLVENSLGNELVRVEVVLEQYGEVWFPRSCSTYGLGTLRRHVEIERATFNDPGMKKLLPAVIGLEPGVLVSPQNGSLPAAPPPGGHVWDGQKPVSYKEWWAAVKKGKRMGPTMEYLWREGSDHIFPQQGNLRPRLDDLSDWERYVLHFIRNYNLNKEQSEKAWKIHRHCKERADEYLRKKTEIIDRLEKDLRQNPADPGLLKKRAALRQPIDDIFKKELVPRLERIPTPAQRQRAASQPAASRPSVMPGTP
ncbi:MAG: hypothetical protein ABIG44_17285 [Planctomycetota bacterium]